jgi:Arc/MetJ-type ribon-helix-helix transcriptional regulator
MHTPEEPDSEPHYLEVLYRDLALALGDAVWAFARIEWLVYEYLGRLSKDHIDELVGEVAFRSRCSILRRLVDRRATTPESKERALRAVQKAEGLAERRNIIVHNPWSVWIDLNAKEFMTEIQKYSNRSSKVDLNELRRFTDSAADVEQELRESLRAL